MTDRHEKFTPGPWYPRITDYQDSRVLTIFNELGIEIGAVCPQSDPDETEANSRMLAAAPEMYDALKSLVEDLCGSGFDALERRVHIIAAKKALQKAGGDK